MSAGIVAQPLENPCCPHCEGALAQELTPLSEVSCPHCFQQVMVPGRLGQQYRLTRLIGAGGMGAVYEGYDDGLARRIAVKVILREKAAEDPSFIESFRKEAQSAARLNSQNIVSIYAFGDVDGQPYLVMELVLPDALDKLMEQGPLMPAAALNYCLQTAKGLKAANEHGLVHGDVKPENILINEAHEAKLADFGIAALSGASAAANNEVWGTPYYIAPETLRQQKVDCRADIYSLGGTLYHAIAGVPPFEGADAVEVMKARLLGPARPLIEVRPDCPESINKIVMRMLEAEPIRRYPNYESLIKDMEKALGALKSSIGSGKRITIKGKSVTGPISMPMPTVVTNMNAPLVPKKSKKGLLIGAIVGGVALLGGGLTTLLLMGGDASDASSSTEALVAANTQVQARAAQVLAQAKLGAKQSLAEAHQAAMQQVATVEAMHRYCEGVFDRLEKAAREVTHEREQAWLDLGAQPEGTPPTELLRQVRVSHGEVATLGEISKQVLAHAEAIKAAESAVETQADVSAVEALVTPLVKPFDLSAATALQQKFREREGALNNWRRLAFNHRREIEQQIVNEQRVAAEQRAKEAAAQEAQQKIAEEVASLESRMGRVQKELKDFMPESAKSEYQKVVQRLKSNEAKQAATIYETRANVVATFKTWLIEWITNGQLAKLQKSVRRDFGFTAATSETVTWKGREMRWGKFFEDERSRIIPVIEYAIAQEIALKELELAPSLRSDLALGAVLLLDTYLADALEKSTTGQALYRRLIEQAQQLKKTSDLLTVLALPLEVGGASADTTSEEEEEVSSSDEE